MGEYVELLSYYVSSRLTEPNGDIGRKTQNIKACWANEINSKHILAVLKMVSWAKSSRIFITIYQFISIY